MMLAAVIVALGVLAIGVGSGTRVAPAQATANTLLQSIALPAGAVAVGREPAGDQSLLAAQPATRVSPRLAQARGWWLVDRSPSAVLRAVARELGWRSPSSTGFEMARDGTTLRYEDLVVGTKPLRRELVVAAVALPRGMTGVRVDAVVGRSDADAGGWTAYAPMRSSR
jgi:hypothetical protein